MCFIKSSSPSVPEAVSQDIVQRKEADASLTKNSNSNREASTFKQNLKTSAFGVEDETNTNKKTLLGE